MDKRRKVLVIASLCVGMLMIGIIVFQQITQVPEMKIVKENLENEFHQIHQLPGAKEIQYYSTIKPEQALVGSTYKADLTFEEISQYYMDELPKQGWNFQGSRNVTVWDRDLGGKELSFTKGKYVLKLDFPGNDPNSNYTFDLTIIRS